MATKAKAKPAKKAPAKKDAEAAKRSAAAKKAAKTKRVNDKPNHPEGRPTATGSKGKFSEDVTGHGFPVGTTVEVHPATVGDIEVQRGRAPLTPPITKGKVKQDGSVSLSVDATGVYTLAGYDEDTDRWRYVKVPVKG